MKKFILSAGALAASVTLLVTHATAQVHRVTCIINGTIRIERGEHLPSKMFLYDTYQGRLRNLDSAAVVNNGYHFSRSINEQKQVTLAAGELQSDPNTHEVLTKGCSVYLAEGVINIVSNASLKNREVTGSGSRATRDFEEATLHSSHYMDSLRALMHTPAFKSDEQFQKRVRSGLGQAFKMELNEQYAFVKKHLDSPIAPDVVGFLAKVGVMLSIIKQEELDALIASLPPASQALVKKKLAAAGTQQNGMIHN